MKFSTHVTAQGNLRETFTQRRTLSNIIQRYGRRRFHACRIRFRLYKLVPIRAPPTHFSCTFHAVPAYEARTHYSPDEAADLRERLFVLEEENDSGVILLTPDEIRLVVDSGASCTIANCLDEFISPPTKAQPRELKGIGSGLQIQGIGTVRYVLNTGYELLVPGTLYVPDCPARLLCPQQLVDILKCTFTMEPDSDTGRPTCWFEFPGKDSAPPSVLTCPSIRARTYLSSPLFLVSLHVRLVTRENPLRLSSQPLLAPPCVIRTCRILGKRHIDEHNSGSGSLQTASVHLRPWILLCFVAGFG